VREVARLVDERMRHIASQLATHDLPKLAILTALNIADELHNLREHYEREVSAAAPSRAGDDAGGHSRAAGAGEEDRRTRDEPASWFEAIFDAEEPERGRGERLSSRVSAKLHALRPSGQGSLAIDIDGPEEESRGS
ncbi:MAG: cell division protein ZapA, partial [Pyrinomonadaceae bacterium]